ncbi:MULTISPECIES: hypothetical protein [Chroococcidiopsis]|nr:MULTISPECIES: hypothetical protein [Chroococcidiopsis]
MRQISFHSSFTLGNTPVIAILCHYLINEFAQPHVEKVTIAL